jgi:hypothetical protein
MASANQAADETVSDAALGPSAVLKVTITNDLQGKAKAKKNTDAR